MTNYIGIDYSLGQSNRDAATGIHYGVISQHSLMPEVINDAIIEGAEYGPARCPKCGTEVNTAEEGESVIFTESSNVASEELIAPNEHSVRTAPDWFDGKDYACLKCEETFWSEECFPDEMQGWKYESEGYVLTDCLDSDVFIIKSPYYTYAQFCSPCVPGAGNLDNPIESELAGAPKTFCLGHDWFENNKAPYIVYRVSDGSVAEPEG